MSVCVAVGSMVGSVEGLDVIPWDIGMRIVNIQMTSKTEILLLPITLELTWFKFLNCYIAKK